MVCTINNLRLSLAETPSALHFSGHGIKNTPENFGKDFNIVKNDGNFLVFEDNLGEAQYVSEKQLKQILDSSGAMLDVVFVASCYSRFAGEIFLNAGAKHVVCVQEGSKISDMASIIFTQAFYHGLFSETLTVCRAFDLAKSQLAG
jgi:hypothetical protein